MTYSNSNTSKSLRTLFVLLMLCISSVVWQSIATAASGLTQIGEVALSKGVATAHSDVRELTALAKGSPIYLGDIIETATRSFLVINFNDGGKVTLRPETRFDLLEYDDTPGKEKESFKLLKGGLRAVTGAIGKARPENVKYTARNTTIGIRGTTFILKMCDEGIDGCEVNSGPGGLDEGESSKKYVDIYVVDKSGGKQQRITREALNQLLKGIYVSVIEGAISVETDQWKMNILAGDKCMVDYSDGGLTQRDATKGVECFLEGQGVEDVDVFLGDDAEDISAFNLFDGGEINTGSQLCEIN